jgi:hypothetical protein
MGQPIRVPLQVTIADRLLRLIFGSILLAAGLVFLAMPFFLGSPSPGEEAKPEGLLSGLLVVGLMTLLTVYSLMLGITFLRSVIARPRIECFESDLVVTHPVLFRSSLRVPLAYVWAIRSKSRNNEDWFTLDDQLILDGAQHILEQEPHSGISVEDVHAFLNATAEMTLPSLGRYPVAKNNLMVLFDRRVELPPRRGGASAGGNFDWGKPPRSREAVRGFIVRTRDAARARGLIESRLPEERRGLRLMMFAPSDRDVVRVTVKRYLALIWLGLFFVSGITRIFVALFE